MPVPLPDTNWPLEWLRIAQGILGTIVGGGLVLLAGWLADRRKNAGEDLLRDRREKALLTGMFAVRNYVMAQVNDWKERGTLSALEPLRTAQAYVHRLIDKAPGESESLMITVIEIGLAVDALVATIDRRAAAPNLHTPTEFTEMFELRVAALEASIEQFDIISGAELTILSNEDLAEFAGFAQSHAGSAR